MKKETIELERDKNWKLGYGKLFDYEWTPNKILDKVVEFTKRKKIRVYSHIVRLEHEFPDGSVYQSQIPGMIGGNGELCDRVRYLDIYYQ